MSSVQKAAPLPPQIKNSAQANEKKNSQELIEFAQASSTSVLAQLKSQVEGLDETPWALWPCRRSTGCTWQACWSPMWH
jgi:hypothetical protein